jgi:hypothetical protein
MAMTSQPITEAEHRAILRVCILAAFADGMQDDAERARIQRIVDGISDEHLDLTTAYQEALEGNSLWQRRRGNCKGRLPRRWLMRWLWVFATRMAH